jgi:hypothetical protein
VSQQRQILQLQYTDALVGRIVDRLEKEGLYDSSLLVVVADHGQAFDPGHHVRWVDDENIDDVAYSPLILKAPHQRQGVVDDSNVTSLDVLPTLAGLLGIDVPWDTDGAPAGSPEVLRRGDEKRIHNFRGVDGMDDEGVVTFSDAARFPRAADRWIGALTDPEDVLSAFHEAAGASSFIGRPLADLRTGSGGSVRVEGLDRLRRRPSDEAPFGVVNGLVDDAPDDAIALLAIDGKVVSGSRLSTDSDGRNGHVIFLVPQGVLDDENEVRMALVLDGAVRELSVE